VLGVGGWEAGLQRGHQALALLQDLVHAPEQRLARRQQALALLLGVRGGCLRARAPPAPEHARSLGTS